MGVRFHSYKLLFVCVSCFDTSRCTFMSVLFSHTDITLTTLQPPFMLACHSRLWRYAVHVAQCMAHWWHKRTMSSEVCKHSSTQVFPLWRASQMKSAHWHKAQTFKRTFWAPHVSSDDLRIGSTCFVCSACKHNRWPCCCCMAWHGMHHPSHCCFHLQHVGCLSFKDNSHKTLTFTFHLNTIMQIPDQYLHLHAYSVFDICSTSSRVRYH